MSDDLLNILDGTTFLVCDRAGDIKASPSEPTGLFIHDTRLLSRWVLTVNGDQLTPISVDDVHYFEARYFLVPGQQDVYVNSTLAVVREHTLDIGLREELTVLNSSGEPVDVTIRLDVDSDFADIFEVKHAAVKKGRRYRRVEDGKLLIGYERARFRRELIVSVDHPARFDESGLTIEARIGAHESWSTTLTAVPDLPMPRGLEQLPVPGLTRRATRDKERDLAEWIERAPRLDAGWESLDRTYRQSLIDLAALRYTPFLGEDQSVPAAGLPWFMTLFGRDSIFTSLQALPFVPSLAATTLRVLALRQGSRFDDFREEEPGRILHEMRYGELTAFDESPHSPYFGSADATPLFVILLDEYERWSGDGELVRWLEPAARAALDWIDQHADLMGNGYVSYQRRNTVNGLENQCWKDSRDGICYHDGRLPGFPRATCELQGYAYDAKVRAARLAAEFWNDPMFADRLRHEADELKQRFNRDFWVEDRQYFALALDGDGSQVDARSSNMGHLLWSGIVEEAKAEAVVRHLFSTEMFSGWGIRTLAQGEGRYNPIGYHTGTVWPFDNSFIAWGLRRYGYGAEAARLAAGILDAATCFDGRLPEAFAGFDRARATSPVQYPTACSPQAWSAGTPLLLLRTMLGLEAVGENLVVRPALPAHVSYLAPLDSPGRGGRLDALGRGLTGPTTTGPHG
ncbi:MAG TPA: glycogen debranching N-terminal domain-containing protein [Micromonospora sp.]